MLIMPTTSWPSSASVPLPIVVPPRSAAASASGWRWPGPWLIRPHLLLLDEPLSALDQPTREELRTLLANLLGGLGIPAIHVTHDRDEALILGDNLAIIVDGQLRQIDPAQHIAAQPADAEVARLLGWVKLGDGSVDRDTISLGDLRLTAPAGVDTGSGVVSVFYRPESVQLAPVSASAAAHGAVNRTIEKVLPTTPLARLHIHGDPPLTALILHRRLAQLELRSGLQITIQLPQDGVTIFPINVQPDPATT